MSLLKSWAWLEANIKRVVIATGIFAVIAFIFSFIVYQRQQKEITAGQIMTSLIVSTAKNANPSQVADDFLNFSAQYSGTKAGKRAAMQAAAALFAAGKYTEAQTQFQKYLDAYPDDLLASQAALGVAACLEAQGNTAAASSAYQKVITQYPNDSTVVSAKLSAARIYELQGKLVEARGLYTDIIHSDPNSPLASEANLRLMILGTISPVSAPKSTSSASAPTTTNAPFTLTQP